MRLEDFYMGKGSYRDTKSGKRELVLRYRDESGDLRYKSFTRDTEEECLQAAMNFAEEYTGNLNADDSTIPEILRTRFDKDLKFNYIKKQSYYRKIETLKIIENDAIGQIPIRKIQKHHINRFLKEITGYSNSTIEKLFLQLKLAFSTAVEADIMTKNPMLAHDIRRPRSSKADKKIRALTEEEQKKLTECILNDKVPKGRNDYRTQILIALYSGMRMGEINALSPDDIDFKQNVVHVRRTISMGTRGKGFLGDTTKTYAGLRDVPISNALRPVLERALAEMLPNDPGLIFYDHGNNRVITTSNVNSYYNRTCDKCGIECNGQHALRHTFATRCIESGVPAIVLKKWLGHTDIHVTLDTYADVFDRMNDTAINTLDTYLDSIESEEEA